MRRTASRRGDPRGRGGETGDRFLIPIVLLAALLGAGACEGRPDTLIYTLETPAPAGSAEPNITVGPDGFYLSWLEPTGATSHALRFARWDGDGWSEPRTVMDRQDLFVNWADFPSLLVLDDGTIAAHWLEKSGPGTYAYDVRMALSRDGGRTWSEDVIPHRDSVQAEHGFVSLFPLDGGVGAVWLDGRATVEGEPMTLRHTRIARDATLDAETLLDPSTCECCQTDVAIADGTPVAVYRGRTADEIRDIRVTRRVDGTWSRPVPVHEDRWVIEACPVNGPAVAAAGTRVAVAWFTAAPEPVDDTGAGSTAPASGAAAGRVMVAFSDDGGSTFGEPIRVDQGGGMGRVDLAMFTDGVALVSWMERSAGAATVRLRSVSPDGRLGGVTPLGTTSAARASGFPRMDGRGDHVVIAFTEAATDSTPARVRARHAVFDGRELAP